MIALITSCLILILMRYLDVLLEIDARHLIRLVVCCQMLLVQVVTYRVEFFLRIVQGRNFSIGEYVLHLDIDGWQIGSLA